VTQGEVEQIQEVMESIAEGQAAIRELETLKPILALVIHKYAKGQVEITLTEQAQLGDVLGLQIKADVNKGSVLLRSVEL
jgi:hypothetical protein